MDNGRSSDRALRLLRERIRPDRVERGRRLPPERDLAVELGVSRRAVREALAQLEAEGRLLRRQGMGTIIIDPPAESGGEAEVKALTSPTELMEARLVLEPAIAALAAVHATSADLEEMRHCLEKSASGVDHRTWEQWDGALHRTIGRAAHNGLIGRLFDLLSSARAHTEWGRLRKASLTPERQRLYTRQHRALLEAVANRDPEGAARQMRTHLLTVKRTLIEQWEGPLPAGTLGDSATENEP